MNYTEKKSRDENFIDGSQNLIISNKNTEIKYSQDVFNQARNYYGRATIEILFPGGKWNGKEYYIHNPLRYDKNIGSFSINEEGFYNDFATCDKGDLIDLVSKSRNIEKLEAAKMIITISGGVIKHTQVVNISHTTINKKDEAVIPIPENVLNTFKPVGSTGQWTYRNLYGIPWCTVVRYDTPDGRKKVIPYYFGGKYLIRGNPLSTKRPLFNTDKLGNNNIPVLIVEGEKCASIEVNGFVTVTWIGGSNAVEKSDFSILENRRVIIWPDADRPGIEVAKRIKKILPHAEILKIINKPEKWDIADAIIEGINPLEFIKNSMVMNQDELSTNENQKNDEEDKPGRPRKSKQVMELLKDYPICRFKDKRYMIRSNQAIIIGSRTYKELIQGEYYRSTGEPLTSAQTDEVINIHRAQAGESAIQEVFIRSAAPTNEISYIDLNDCNNTIIEVDASGWRVAIDPPVLFLRHSNMGTLPMPDMNGSIDHLKKLLNLEREEDFSVIVAALVYILRGRPFNRGSYPIIVTTGIEGSAKTTFMKIIKKLIDPGTPETRTPPNDTRDLFIASNNCLVLSLDNISTISRDMSDALCSLATGGGFARKLNYTDDEEQIFDLCRPILINGISFDKAPDLLSRAIPIELKPIEQEDRKTEAEIWAQVDLYRPSIFGALLTILSNSIREEAKMKNEPTRLPRLADFGKFSIALEKGNGWEEGKINSSLASSYKAALGENAETNPLIPLLIKFAQNKEFWMGTATELLNEVNRMARDSDKRLSIWPKTSGKFGTLIKANHNVFDSKGISIKHTRRSNERLIELSSNQKSDNVISKNIPDFDDLPIIETW